jgi:hypothetical protein
VYQTWVDFPSILGLPERTPYFTNGVIELMGLLIEHLPAFKNYSVSAHLAYFS